MKSWIVAFSCTCFCVALSTPAAAARCTFVQQATMFEGTAQVTTVRHCAGTESSGGSGHGALSAPRDSGLDSICAQTAITIGLDPETFCTEPTDPRTPPAAQITPGSVAAAFRRIPLPPAKLIIQPPNGRTLVNFDTNFYTRQGQLTRTITLLGQQVHLRIRPATFTWHYGDGTTEHTTTPGAAYPDLQITHQYNHTGRVAPRLDTTYAAQYQVGDRPWQDVTGTVTIPGPARALRVVEARPVLVGS